MIERAAVVVACGLALCPGAAHAQEGRFEVSVGAGWLGAALIGTEAAVLTGNDGGAFTLFTTESELRGATFASAAIGVGVSPLVDLEVRGTYGRPTLAVRIAGDAEGADAVDVSERVREFTVAAAVVVHPSAWRIGPRARVFASGGAGYLRHLHEDGTYAEAGRIYLAGGGLNYRLAGRDGGTRSAGLRVDAGVAVREGGAVLDGGAHAAPLLGVSLSLRF